MTKQERVSRFEQLMGDINKNYSTGSKVYVGTLEGKVLATVKSSNPSPFLVSCSVTFDLGNGKLQTQMFTN